MNAGICESVPLPQLQQEQQNILKTNCKSNSKWPSKQNLTLPSILYYKRLKKIYIN